jgi:hypothetical protein
MGDMGWRIVPDGCDCCGRDAEDCGMGASGWVPDSTLLAGGGVYCMACAHLLRIMRQPEFCAWCETLMLEEEAAEAQGWAYFVDELGVLHPCCPGCLATQFGIAGRFWLRGVS